MKQDIRDRLKTEVLLADGAMGTLLVSRGAAPRETSNVPIAPSARRTSVFRRSRMSCFMKNPSEDEGAFRAIRFRSASISSLPGRAGAGIGTCHPTLPDAVSAGRGGAGCRGIAGPVPPPLVMKPGLNGE